MVDDPVPTPIGLSLPGKSGFTAVICLGTALRRALEVAAFPERLKVNEQSGIVRLETLTQELLRQAKNTITDSASEADEVAGVRAAITIINEMSRRLRT
jgi:hypothetical protein